MKSSFLMMLLAALSVSAIGCGSGGPSTSLVTGTVTLDGQPIPDGHIVFRDKGGETVAAAGRITNGKYEFEAIPGEKLVSITASRDVPGKFDESNPGEKVQITEQYIPPQYNQETELSVTVTDADETFDFDLVSE